MLSSASPLKSDFAGSGNLLRVWHVSDFFGTSYSNCMEGTDGDGNTLFSSCQSLCIAGHRDIITSVAFSPDGSKLVSASVDKSVCLWRLSGSNVSLVGIMQGFNCMTGAFAARTNSSYCKWYNQYKSDPTMLWTSSTDSVTSVAFSPDGERISMAVVHSVNSSPCMIFSMHSWTPLNLFVKYIRPSFQLCRC